MRLLQERPAPPETVDTDALIQEARRLRRRRWLIGLVVIIVAGAVGGLGYAVVARAPRRAIINPTHTVTPVGAATAAFVTPKSPEALAVGPNGDLYLVDSGRDQILRRLPNGKFQVVAGTGKRGLSGDGGPAVDAKINLGEFGTSSGVAVAPNGAVYFSDSGNDRVPRAVLKDGDIETVVGGGREPLPTKIGELVAARSASLGSPAGLTIGPNGELYIAATFIVRLTATGQIAWVAGSTSGTPPACNATTCALQEPNFGSAGSLAFDGAGDLVVTSGDFPGAGWGIAEIRTSGALVDIGSCRGEGGKPGALTQASAGSVICAAQTGLYRIANRSESEALIPGAAAGGRLPSPLSAALGIERNRPGAFFGGDGIASGRNGAIYADTAPLASATPEAIVELFPSGTARALWKS